MDRIALNKALAETQSAKKIEGFKERIVYQNLRTERFKESSHVDLQMKTEEHRLKLHSLQELRVRKKRIQDSKLQQVMAKYTYVNKLKQEKERLNQQVVDSI